MEGLHWRKVGAVAFDDLGDGGDSEGARDGKEAGEEEGKAHNEGEGETKVGGSKRRRVALPAAMVELRVKRGSQTMHNGVASWAGEVL